MKLLTKTTLYYFTLSGIVFIVGGIITFFLVRVAIDQDINEFFNRAEERLMKRIEKGEFDLQNPPKYSRFVIKSLAQKPDNQALMPVFKDTIMRFDNWEMNFRQKTFVREIKGKYYQIKFVKSLEDAESEIEAVLYTILGLFVALMSVLIGFNYFLAKRIWHPFNQTLAQIKNFNLRDKKKLELPHTNIVEFDELNRLVGEMTEKIRQDYNSLKEFTENASHELQTPLAIIQSKLEILIENPNTTEEQSKLIESAYEATSKLSRLGRALALLTRIENQEFSDFQTLNFQQVLAKNLEHFKELLELRQIKLTTHTAAEVVLQIDPSLADMLLSNLLKNAIRHNIPQGKIEIDLCNQKFLIRNTGKPLQVPPHTLFERFQKDNPASGSLGLGLAIVKKICEVNQFLIHYTCEAGWHQVEVVFHKVNTGPKNKNLVSL
ncbi:MAG: HAMP domain-containing histidine kinase [Microscillaceae bacterium]|nr:HAMP domain-containing histidine kinase [Microscillaceae bacterium]